MALIQKGNNYFIYYFDRGKIVWRKTGLSDKKQAQAVHDEFMSKRKKEKQQAIVAELLEIKQPENIRIIAPKSKNRIRLDAMLSQVQKYRAISVNHTRAFNRFVKSLPKSVQYCDQVTAETAFNYLRSHYSTGSGKSWNNNKTYLHSLFKTILIDASMPESPFARVIQKRDNGKHQRPFTEAECIKIIKAAKEPWKSACLIAYHTGLRQKDCFALQWTDIAKNVITITPAKTGRYNKAVQIPIHPQLAEHLSTLKRKDNRVLGFSDIKCHNSGSFTKYFGGLLDTLKITDSESGIVNFNSFRNTFITRCRAAGIAEHAIRGIAGHGDKAMTDLYSHDITAAKSILKLKAIKIKQV